MDDVLSIGRREVLLEPSWSVSSQDVEEQQSLFPGAVLATGPQHHGYQYMSRVFQNELCFLGITSSPSYVGSPEGNGVAERMVRTLKEQLLWVDTFDTVEELRAALQALRDTYNDNWLLGRWRHRTPTAVRAELTTHQAVA